MLKWQDVIIYLYLSLIPKFFYYFIDIGCSILSSFNSFLIQFNWSLLYDYETLFLRTNNLLDFRSHYLQHDQLPSTIFVSKGNNGSLVVAHGDKEDINTAVEYTHLSTILHTP